MMTRTRTLFYCSDCGNESARWAGQCPVCGAWNTIDFENSAGAENRVLRTTRNRFGSADELGVFRMTSSGLVGAEDAAVSRPGSLNIHCVDRIDSFVQELIG